MHSDPLMFQLFKDIPSCFFQLLGRSESLADEYRLEAVEYKATAVRLDGLFRPKPDSTEPAYLWEAQFHRSEKVYANLLSKIGRFLEHGNPEQDWVAVVIYPSRSLEQKCQKPYRCLINSDQLKCIYLDELAPAGPDEFGLGILQLIASKPQAALEKAKELVPRVRASKRLGKIQDQMIQLIETVIVHQFPTWTREEIESMLQVTDARKTRVYQDALVEGRQLEREAVATRLLIKGLPVDEIAEISGLPTTQVRKLAKKLKE